MVLIAGTAAIICTNWGDQEPHDRSGLWTIPMHFRDPRGTKFD